MQSTPSPPEVSISGAARRGRRIISHKIEKLEEEVAGLKRKAETQKPKDAWDKLSVVATLFSTIVIGTVGAAATYVYNQHESARLEAQNETANTLHRLEIIEKFFPNLKDSDPRIRITSIKLIAAADPALGETVGQQFRTDADASVKVAALAVVADNNPRNAIKLVQASAVQGDEPVLATLVKNSDKEISGPAATVLLRLQSPDRIAAIINVFEHGTTSRDYATVMSSSAGVGYGIAEIHSATGELYFFLKEYSESAVAKMGGAFVAFLPRLKDKDPLLGNDRVFLGLLRDAAGDPVMQQLQDIYFARHYLQPAANDAAALGIKSVLGVAVISDSRVQGGFPLNRDATIQKLNGTPSTGVSEKLWIETYLQLRREWKEKLPAPIPSTVYREDTFLGLVSAGNWDLVPPLTIRGKEIK